MLDSSSILRRLPKALNKKQSLFLNGIRHSAEFSMFSYRRLTETLTHIAVNDLPVEESTRLYTSAFIDAWTIVDAFDRLRLLMLLFPNRSAATSKPPVSELAQLARNVRNVADHLAQRADEVIAKNGTALGVLMWYTVVDRESGEGVSCGILPGGVPDGTYSAVHPAGKVVRPPTDLVHLTAGGYTLSLSELVTHIETLILALQDELSGQIPAELGEDQIMPTDVLVKVRMQIAAG